MDKKAIIKSIDLMVITTADLEKCLHFYEGLLGMEHKIEGGGGQPIHDGQECAYARGGKLDDLDVNNQIRYSHENPDVFALYNEYLGKPLSHLLHTLLHTDQTAWSL